MSIFCWFDVQFILEKKLSKKTCWGHISLANVLKSSHSDKLILLCNMKNIYIYSLKFQNDKLKWSFKEILSFHVRLNFQWKKNFFTFMSAKRRISISIHRRFYAEIEFVPTLKSWLWLWWIAVRFFSFQVEKLKRTILTPRHKMRQ